MTQSSTRRLGKYEIIEELGKGGFATVYRARDPDLDREVALKVLDPLLTRDPVWVARFRREARAVARLDHPHVVTIYEVGEADGMLYIATRLVEGGNLAGRIREGGPLPWDEVVRLTSEIASALEYAHKAGVVHRDLKSSNVLLDWERGAQLTDFGFASIVSESSFSVSISGGVVGTPQYIAPEVWEGQPATPQTDIYALGCILYEMVVGKHLFQGDTTPSVMRAHFQPVALPGAWPEGVPPGFEAVLEKALAQEPGERHARAGELAEAVAALREDSLAGPYASLEAAVAAGEWEQALELAREIRVEDTGYGEVVALEGAALAGLDGAVRAREAATWKVEAERALAEGDLRGATMAARQWGTLLPGDAALREFMHRVKQVRAAAGIEPLRKPRPERANAPITTAQEIPSQAAVLAAWWLLALSIIIIIIITLTHVLVFGGVMMLGGILLYLGDLASGAGILGIVGAIAMLKGRPWGRKVGLAAALLIEVAGLLGTLRMAYVTYGVSWAIYTMVVGVLCVDIVLAYLLSRETVVCGMGEEPRYLAGGWAMTVPAVLTLVGIPSAVGLLRNRKWGHVGMMIFLAGFALFALAVVMIAGYEGRILTMFGVAVVVLWCVAGLFYLNSPRVRAWFEAHDDSTARGASA